MSWQVNLPLIPPMDSPECQGNASGSENSGHSDLGSSNTDSIPPHTVAETWVHFDEAESSGDENDDPRLESRRLWRQHADSESLTDPSHNLTQLLTDQLVREQDQTVYELHSVVKGAVGDLANDDAPMEFIRCYLSRFANPENAAPLQARGSPDFDRGHLESLLDTYPWTLAPSYCPPITTKLIQDINRVGCRHPNVSIRDDIERQYDWIVCFEPDITIAWNACLHIMLAHHVRFSSRPKTPGFAGLPFDILALLMEGDQVWSRVTTNAEGNELRLLDDPTSTSRPFQEALDLIANHGRESARPVKVLFLVGSTYHMQIAEALCRAPVGLSCGLTLVLMDTAIESRQYVRPDGVHPVVWQSVDLSYMVFLMKRFKEDPISRLHICPRKSLEDSIAHAISAGWKTDLTPHLEEIRAVSCTDCVTHGLLSPVARDYLPPGPLTLESILEFYTTLQTLVHGTVVQRNLQFRQEVRR